MTFMCVQKSVHLLTFCYSDVPIVLPWQTNCNGGMPPVQDAVRALKSRLADATAALQISHSEALRLRTRVADLKAAVCSVSPSCDGLVSP